MPPSLLEGLGSPLPKLPATPTAPVMRGFGDIPATRRNIYDNVLKAARELPLVENTSLQLQLTGADYDDPGEFSLARQKQAILGGQTLGRKLRGTWALKDKATGNVLSTRRTTLATVPFLTHRGTFILNGTEYTLGNQLRMKPGVYTRQKESGEIESHVNVKGGLAHRIQMDPATSVFQLQVGQSHMPLLPLLKAFGLNDSDLRTAWGNEIYAANAVKDDATVLKKLHQRLFRGEAPAGDHAAMTQAVTDAFRKMQLDPEVMRRTLGQPIATVGPEQMLAVTQKLLAINKGEADVDDRDHLAFQTLHGPEDLFAERFGRDKLLLRKQLWKAALTKKLDHIPAGLMNKALLGAITSSGLGAPSESINPSMFLEQLGRVSRLGEGAIGSLDAVPQEARAVQPSYFGFVDPVVTPESLRAGVDSRLAYNTQKGNDGKLYTQVLDMQTGERVWKSAEDLADEILVFPGEMQSGRKRVNAMVKGQILPVRRNAARYALPDMAHAFAAISNMVPMKSAMKGQRVAMGHRMLTQALPLHNAEAPLVQSGDPDGDQSFEAKYGDYFGAVRSQGGGRVVAVEPDTITLRGLDGKTQKIELYNNHPFNRKTLIHNTPLVQVGQTVQPGQLLARSNYTNDQGVTALGTNLRTAYLPYRGLNFEDAVVISESAARDKLSSEHMYQQTLDKSDDLRLGKSQFASMFPSTFARKVLDNMDSDGVVKPGTELNPGDPIILAARKREMSANRLHKARDRSFADQSETWTHHSPGIVTDVSKTDKGITVTIKSRMAAQVGDKLCYDKKTEILTARGWKSVAKVTTADQVATLDPETGVFSYLNPSATQTFDHHGKMYKLQTTQVDLLVTDNHKLYAQPRQAEEYTLIEARELYGKRYRMKKNADWNGDSPDSFVFPSEIVRAGQFGNGSRVIPALSMPVQTYLMLLGMFLSEGSTFCNASGYGIDICQVKPEGRKKLVAALHAAGFKFTDNPNCDKIRLHGLQLYKHFHQFGNSKEKFIPPQVFNWSSEHLQILYCWMMWGDGGETGTGHTYFTSSERLANDVQRLLLHIGISGTIKSKPACWEMIKGKLCYVSKRYFVHVYRHKNAPEINHGHASRQNGQSESWQQFKGRVYCVTMPHCHVIYVRRNGKTVWCGNSGRMGDKGVISRIIPDAEMIRDSQGQPFDILVNDLGVITRSNPAQAVEAALGKIAQLTGKPYVMRDFNNRIKLLEFAQQELQKYGLSDTEDVTDPTQGDRLIKRILTGPRFFMKLHHQAESKGQGRGTGGYTAEGTPARGGGEAGKSKRVSLMDLNALLSHGATAVARDAHVTRGQENPEYWMAYMSGHKPPPASVPRTHHKFLAMLRGAGINPVRTGMKINIMALTDKDVDELAGDRELKNAETVDWKQQLKPIPGGLFDTALTGGHNSNLWSSFRLAEPMPNPVMEEPIRRLLGLTEKRYLGILSGQEKLGEFSGPAAISHALARLNIDREMERARQEIASGRKTYRDAAVRKLQYLKAAKANGLHPKDWVLSKVPVLPTIFRPISLMQGSKLPMVSDPNVLYRDMFEANDSLRTMKLELDDVADERLAAYNALKAVVGLGDPIQPKSQERQVKGLLRKIFGDAPKRGFVQQKLLGSTVDMTGRAVIVPDPDLDMDEVGIPEDKAWSIYQHHIVRRLVRDGFDRVAAVRAVKERNSQARQAMLNELSERPVIINRAPTLHRYNKMAFWPKLVTDETLHTSPLVIGGFAGDYDGDQMTYHVPQSEDSVQEAIDKMLPSRNLLAVSNFKVHQLPGKEYGGGLYAATTRHDDKPARVYATQRDAVRAYLRGEIGVGQSVEIINP